MNEKVHLKINHRNCLFTPVHISCMLACRIAYQIIFEYRVRHCKFVLIAYFMSLVVDTSIARKNWNLCST